MDNLVEVVDVDVAEKSDRDILNKMLKGCCPADIVNNVIMAKLMKKPARRSKKKVVSEKHAVKRESAKRRSNKASKTKVSKTSKKKSSSKSKSKSKRGKKTPSTTCSKSKTKKLKTK